MKNYLTACRLSVFAVIGLENTDVQFLQPTIRSCPAGRGAIGDSTCTRLLPGELHEYYFVQEVMMIPPLQVVTKTTCHVYVRPNDLHLSKRVHHSKIYTFLFFVSFLLYFFPHPTDITVSTS